MTTQADESFAIIKKALQTGEATIGITDFKRLNKAPSPAFNAWDNLIPLLLLILISVFVLLIFGLFAGTVSLLGAVLIYLVVVRLWIASRVKERLAEILKSHTQAFQIMWTVGGFGLIAKGPMGMLTCAAPKGDWKSFAAKLAQNRPPPSIFGDDSSNTPSAPDGGGGGYKGPMSGPMIGGLLGENK